MNLPITLKSNKLTLKLDFFTFLDMIYFHLNVSEKKNKSQKYIPKCRKGEYTSLKNELKYEKNLNNKIFHMS